MNEDCDALQPRTPLPADNLERRHTIARPDTDPTLPHVGLVGDTYTILLSGQDTNGRYCLIDVLQRGHRRPGELEEVNAPVREIGEVGRPIARSSAWRTERARCSSCDTITAALFPCLMTDTV